MIYYLEVEYPLEYYPMMEDHIKMLAAEYLGEIVGSGAGLGFRDLQIKLRCKKSSNGFISRLPSIVREMK